MTSTKNQQEAQSVTGYGPIALRRVGDFAVVEVEVPSGNGGSPTWVEVIREHLDGNFSHIVEPVGIRECIERKSEMPEGVK